MNMTKTITMTFEQWTSLSSFILMTTNYRKGERETWERLSTETKEDGTPAYRNAPGNAQFWADMDLELDEIRRIIENTNPDI